jgi:SAM-dependent methyltransferase
MGSVERLFSMKPDYSEFLTPDQLAVEEALWATCGLYPKYAGLLKQTIELLGARATKPTVIEIGCGTGWVPTLLPELVPYTGVDKNPRCLDLAREKNLAHRKWLNFDVREFTLDFPRDIVASFAVLKHFSLSEWDSIFAKVLSFGHWAVFTLPVSHNKGGISLASTPEVQRAMPNYDDGVEFPHVHIGRTHLDLQIELAGKELVASGPLDGEDEEWFILGPI